MADKVTLELEPDEVRYIAVLRAIVQYDKLHLIGPEDTGVVVSLLQAAFPELTALENESTPAELKLFLKAFIAGLAATKVEPTQYVPQYEETEYVGGRSGGVAVGQGEDERFVAQTGPQE